MSIYRTVLVITDSDESDRDYGYHLQQDPHIEYKILTGHRCSPILTQLEPDQLDGILLNLPQANGISFLHQIQNQMGDRCPPIVVIASDDAQLAVQALKNGATDYLVKDRMTPDDLRLAMRSVVDDAERRIAFHQNQEKFYTSNITQHKTLELELNQTIADLKRQEAAIQQLNQDLTHRVAELQSLLEIIPVGIAIADEPSCAHMHHNAYLRQLLGVESNHNISKSAPTGEQPAFRVFQNGQEIPVDDLPMQKAVKLGVDVQDEEIDIVRPDGTIHQLLSYATPLRDNQNQIRGVVGAFLDVTKRNQDAAALMASQRRYRELAEAIPQMVWTADATGIINYFNQRWYEYTGLTEAESMEASRALVVHPDDYDRTLAQWNRAIAHEELFEVEYRLRCWDGTYQWFICRAIPSRNSQNQVTDWIGTITNIDDIKRSEALMRQKEQQLQQQLAEIEAIYESAPVGLNVLDENLRFVRINQRLADINGLPIEAHIGRTVRDIFPGMADTVEELLRPILKTGEPLLNVEIQGETPAKPGIKRTWLEHFLPLKAGDQIVGISTVCEEITERVKIETALRASEEKFRLMADNAPAMIWVTDADGYCTYLNQGWYDFTGQTEATGLGFGWLNAVHPEDSEPSKATFLEANHRKEAFRLEYRLRRKDGKYCCCIDAASPYFDEKGEFRGYIGSVFDISDRKQAEEDLRLSEERYRTLFESMNDGFCVVEVLFDDQNKPIDYCFLEANPAFVQQTGLQQAVGRTARQLLPDLESHWFEIYGTVALTGEPIRFENGSDVMNRWFDVAAFKVGQAESHKVAILFKDISERKQAERKLREGETRFRTLADNISQFAWMADEKGWVFWYNQRWFDYTGTTPEEMQGWGWKKVHHPDHIDRVVDKISRCFETGEVWEDTFPLRGKDGQYRWFLSRAIPVLNEEGEVLRWFGTNTDITDREHAEEALRESENRLRIALESTRLGTWDFNPITKVLQWDDRCKALFGLSPDAEVTYDVFLAGLHPDDRDRTHQIVLYSFDPDSGGEYDIEYRTIGIEDGVERWVAAKGKTFFDLSGVAVRFIGTVLDITEKKRAEAEREQLLQREQAAREAAERANRIKDEFLAVLSHELRSPLNPILGWTKLLQTRRLSPEKTSEALATIERNAKLQTQLVDDLLDIAKILRGKLSLTMESVNLSFVIESAIETVTAAAIAKSITLNPVLVNIGQVFGDAARLQQVVWNLLSNAIKFTPNGGQIDIVLEQVDFQAKITVKDTGKGIVPEFLPYIFESFRQEDASITRKYGGLGLGLAIVRQLVEAHGGTISVDSLGEGKGATFTVLLPLLSIYPEPKPTNEIPQQNLNLQGMRILAVDDDPDARELLTALLSHYGADVLAVSSAFEVLNQLPSFQPDALVSDIGMPNVDGYSLIQHIRMLPPEQGGQVPAIALTAYAREDDHKQAIASGYQQHLTKPLDPDEIVKAILLITQATQT